MLLIILLVLVISSNASSFSCSSFNVSNPIAPPNCDRLTENEQIARLKCIRDQMSLTKSTVFFPGFVIQYPGTTIPSGWLPCDGRSLLKSSFPSLFAAIGNAHGESGNSFFLPDYRGRFQRMVAGSSGNDPNVGNREAIQTGGSTQDSVGSLQRKATKLPTPLIEFTSDVDSWTHQHSMYSHTGDTGGGVRPGTGVAIERFYTRLSSSDVGNAGIEFDKNYFSGSADVEHTHAFQGSLEGFEADTRPPNAQVMFIIKT